MSEKPVKIDVNQAGLEALTVLPGVGEEIAARIISRRPYKGAGELLNVPGIGPKGVERLTPYLVFNAEPGSNNQGVRSTSRGMPSPGSRSGAGVEKGAPEAGRGITRQTLLWFCLGTGLVSVLVSVILSLAILAGINGTLSIERNASIRQLNGRASAAEQQLEELGASIDSLETRLKSVEGLSGRMTTMEDEFASMREQVDAARAEVDGIQTTVSGLSGQIGSLESRVSVFDAFLRGIERILQEVLPQQPMEVP
jgi:prefoldin subunit 5